MKQLYSSMELPIGKNQFHKKSNPKFVIVHRAAALTTLTILIFIPLLYYPLQCYPSILLNSTSAQSIVLVPPPPPPPPPPRPPRNVVEEYSSVSLGLSEECDLFMGKWVWDPDNAPHYTNTTCSAIHEQYNCMKYGKPNLDFTKWRWKPDECELPVFNAEQFLELLRGKSLAIVGDSVARNHLGSLECLLSKVGYPVDVSNYSSQVQIKTMFYTNYNFTLSNIWSPYLVKGKQTGPSKSDNFNVYLDELDEDWTTHIDKFDYIIISAGHWFFRPTMFYDNDQLAGCLYCKDNNVTHFDHTYGYRRAFKTVFRAINSLEKFKGTTTFLRTFSPSHFKNGSWNKGGNCVRTRPYMSNETRLNGQDLEMYITQLEEFRVAEREGMKTGLKFRLLDITRAMWFRQDGHPSSYWHRPEEVDKYNDCVHWCSPGPIDTWSDFLLEMLKRES